eukprot:TRINITY_DN3954_c0_g1_i2.p1 TRINITY_DN3954_c0_g1~~TRINITY_DN3954_c0_g1_i2.p1  ORF type:complete len:123 (+),score=36.81 TRINITY_DN3954_c0_g1_i2:172-540(+)
MLRRWTQIYVRSLKGTNLEFASRIEESAILKHLETHKDNDYGRDTSGDSHTEDASSVASPPSSQQQLHSYTPVGSWRVEEIAVLIEDDDHSRVCDRILLSSHSSSSSSTTTTRSSSSSSSPS